MVPARVSSCGICGGHSGTGADFLRVRLFPLPIIPSSAQHSSGAGTIGQMVAKVPSGPRITPSQLKLKFRGFCPRPNYTNQATAACLVPTFADRGVSCSLLNGSPTAVPGAAIFFKYISCTHEAEWTPFQTHYCLKNLVAP
jgi:hypothetical protein